MGVGGVAGAAMAREQLDRRLCPGGWEGVLRQLEGSRIARSKRRTDPPGKTLALWRSRRGMQQGLREVRLGYGVGEARWCCTVAFRSPATEHSPGKQTRMRERPPLHTAICACLDARNLQTEPTTLALTDRQKMQARDSTDGGGSDDEGAKEQKAKKKKKKKTAKATPACR